MNNTTIALLASCILTLSTMASASNVNSHNTDKSNNSVRNVHSGNVIDSGNSYNGGGNDHSTTTNSNNGNSYNTTVDNSTTRTVNRGGSVGDTSSTSLATGGSVGDTSSTSLATGGSVGDTTATGGSVGDTVAQSTNDNSATVGNVGSTAESTNSNDSEGGAVDFDYNYSNIQAENAASSAASVLTGFCQTGGSAQGFSGGFTLTGNDQFCDRIRMADYYWIQYERQVQLSSTFSCHAPVKALTKRCGIIGERMLVSLDKAWENTEEANSLLDSGKLAAKVEKATGPLARIGGILSILLIL